MEPIAKVVAEYFMMVLCVTSAPVDQQEIRIDVIEDGAYVDTMIVRREEVGFTVHDEMNGKLVKFMTIVPKDGVENALVCTDHKGKSGTVDLTQAIEGLDVSQLRTRPRLRLKAKDGVNFAIDRSNEVVFITPDKLKRTYVVH
jgi:hypothetical protein